MTQTDLTAVDEPKVTPVPQGPEVPEDTPVTQGPEVPQPDDEYQQLLEQARAGDQGARGKLRGRLMDPLTPPQVKQDITSALQAGAPEEAKEIKKEGDRYRPAWFGEKGAPVSLGRLRNAETLGRTKMSPEYLERLESGAAGFIEQYAETVVLPPARAISIALGIPDVDVEQTTRELQNDIEFMEARILPKAVQALKDGHSTQEVIQGLAKQGIEADRALGESIDSAFSEEGIDTKGGYARLFSSPGELFIQRVKQLPEEELSWDVVKRDAAKAIPLIGTLLESADQNRIEDAVNRIADNEGTEEDKMLVEGMLIDQYRSRSLGLKSVEGIIDMAGFGADLWAGGAIGKGAGRLLGLAGKAVGLAKFNKALSNVAAWSAKTPTSFMSRMGRAGVRGGMEAGRIAGTTAAQVGGEALGSAAVTGAFGEEAVFGRAELETQRQQIMQAISGGIDPVSGKTFFAADRIPEDAPEITLPNAVGLMVDVAVEKLGRFAAMPGLAKTPASRLRMLDSLARAADPALADRLAGALKRGASKLEIDGIVGEIMEEYASRTGMAAIGEITGDPEYGKLADIIPSGEAIADEFIAIASGAGAMRAPVAAASMAAEAGVTPRARKRLQQRAEYLRDVEAAATDPAAAERVRQVNETTRRATGEEIDTVLQGVGGTRVEQPEGPEAEQAAERAKSLGLELVFYDGPAEQTGFYDKSSPSTIYINTKAEDPGAALEIETTIHEVAHDMEAVIGEEAFDSLTSKLRDADPERWEETKEDAQAELGEIFGEGVFRPVGRDAESEAAATRAEDNGVLVDLLLRNPDAQVDVQRILKSDQSLLQRVRDGVRNMLSVLPGVKSAKDKGMENLRAELQKRGLEGEELDAAVEQSQLETADEVAAAMKDVAEMRSLARRRQSEAYLEGATVSDDALYGTEEEFQQALEEAEEVAVPEEAVAEVEPEAAPPAEPAAPARTLAEVEAEIAEIQAKGKKSTLADRRRKKLLQEEADALRAQEAAPAEVPAAEAEAPPTGPQFARRRTRRREPVMFYRGTTPGRTERIDEPFDAGKGKTFAARSKDSALMYGASLEAITAKPGAKILYQEDADFWRLLGKKRPPNGEIASSGVSIIDGVNRIIRAAESEGYDAVSFARDADVGTVILNEDAFSRAPVQEADTGQTQFARRRTRRRKPPEVMDRFDLEPPTRLERFRISVFDRLSRLERFERDAYEKGLRLAEAESPTMAARLMPGKTTYKQEQLELNYINPIFGILSDAGIKIPEFEDFLILRTTKESNEDLREKRQKAVANRQQARILTRRSKDPIDRTLPEDVKEDLRKQRKADEKEAKRLRREADYIDPGDNPKSFYTDEEAEAKLAEIDKNPQLRKSLDEAGRLVDEMNKAARKQLLDSGLISQEQHDLWEEKFKHYVPFKSEEAGSSWVETGTVGYSVRGPEAKIRRGTTRKPNPLLFSFQQASRAIVRGEKNQVGVRAYNFFQKANMLADVEEVEPGQSMPDLSGTAKFGLKINGEQKIVTLKDEYLARALKNMGPGRKGDPTMFDKFIERAGKITRFMANANTQYNPDFLLVNPIRDQIEAQLKVGELRERGFSVNRASLFADSFRAYKALRGGPGKESGIMGDYYRRFGEAGGLIRLGDMQDYQEGMAALEAKLQRMSDDQSRSIVSSTFHAVGDLISRRNRAMELAVRLSVFKQLTDSGTTDAKAAEIARDITVDFNRRGQDTATINSLFMFFNASLQGTDRNLRALKTKSGKLTAGSLMMAGYMHSMLMAAGSDEDEDGRLEWDNEKWYNKARNYVLGIGAGKILKLPLPYFWSIPFFAGQLLESVTRGAMNASEAGALLAANIANDLTPFSFGSEPNTFMNRGLLVQFLPDVVRAPFELAVNRDYRGEAILRERFPGETTPARERGKSDWVVSNTVSKVLAGLTGQTPLDIGGPFDWNPDAVEYLYDEYFGGAGATAGRIAKVAQSALAWEAPEMYDIPVLRRFAGIGSYGGVRNNYFDLKERVEKANSRYKALGKQGDKDSQAWIKEQDPTALGYANRIRWTEKRRKALYDERNAAESKEDRRAIEDKIDALLGAAVEDFDKKEAKR